MFYWFRGWRPLGRNIRYPEGEIDLVLRRGGTVVFVEVKTRQQEHAGAPWEAVDRPKQLRIIRMAERFLHESGLQPATVRFDVISIVRVGRRYRLTHYSDAFRPESDPLRPWRLR